MGLYYRLSNGEDIEIRIKQDDGFDQVVTVVLFNGSMSFTYKLDSTILLNDIIQQIEDDYNKLKAEDLQFFYQANGFYD